MWPTIRFADWLSLNYSAGKLSNWLLKSVNGRQVDWQMSADILLRGHSFMRPAIAHMFWHHTKSKPQEADDPPPSSARLYWGHLCVFPGTSWYAVLHTNDSHVLAVSCFTQPVSLEPPALRPLPSASCLSLLWMHPILGLERPSTHVLKSSSKPVVNYN